MRLINYMRKLGPAEARAQIASISKDCGIWNDDSLLQPVLDDDVLLFEIDDDEEDWENDCTGLAASSFAGHGLTKDEEIEQLQAELASARRMLAMAAAEEDGARPTPA